MVIKGWVVQRIKTGRFAECQTWSFSGVKTLIFSTKEAAEKERIQKRRPHKWRVMYVAFAVR